MPPSLLISASSPLRRLARQRRFARRELTILLPKDDYYVQAECARALRSLGHRVIEVVLGRNGELDPAKSSMQLLLQAVVAHRPDMLLTINYLGFDRAAWFDEAIAAIELPTAVWLVDNPFVLGLGYLAPIPGLMTLFVWDASYVPVLAAHGADDVHHLPLATCPSIFNGKAAPSGPLLPLSFVGHSLHILCRYWQEQCDEPSRLAAESHAEVLLADGSQLHALVPRVGPPIDRRILPLAYATYLASKRRRGDALRALPSSQLHVFGDSGWAHEVPQAHLHGSCAYGPDTAKIFRSSAVNINVTNCQMPTGVNQRLFDVPASGGFLLTDEQQEVRGYFEPDLEVATFASDAELRDKALFFARSERARRLMVRRAQQRIASEHTYVHRMRALLAHMESKHAERARRGPPGDKRCDSPLSPSS